MKSTTRVAKSLQRWKTLCSSVAVALLLIAFVALNQRGTRNRSAVRAAGSLPPCKRGTSPPVLALEVPATDEKPEVYCGNWQREYAALHKNVLAGRAPKRYAVAFTASGLADALVDLLLTSQMLCMFFCCPTALVPYGTKPVPAVLILLVDKRLLTELVSWVHLG
jgi:hypothetical protein